MAQFISLTTIDRENEQEVLSYLDKLLEISSTERETTISVGASARKIHMGILPTAPDTAAGVLNMYKYIADTINSRFIQIVPTSMAKSKHPEFAKTGEEIRNKILYTIQRSGNKSLIKKLGNDIVHYSNAYIFYNVDENRIEHVYAPNSFIDPYCSDVFSYSRLANWGAIREIVSIDALKTKYELEDDFDFPQVSDKTGFDMIDSNWLDALNDAPSTPMYAINSAPANPSAQRLSDSMDMSLSKFPEFTGQTEVFTMWIVDPESSTSIREYVFLRNKKILFEREYPYEFIPLFPLVINEENGVPFGVPILLHIVKNQRAIDFYSTKFAQNHQMFANPLVVGNKKDFTVTERDTDGTVTTKNIKIDFAGMTQLGCESPDQIRILQGGQVGIENMKVWDSIISNTEKELGISELIQGMGAEGSKTAYEVSQIMANALPRFKMNMISLEDVFEDISKAITTVYLSENNLDEPPEMNYDFQLIVSEGNQKDLKVRMFMEMLSNLRNSLGDTVSPDKLLTLAAKLSDTEEFLKDIQDIIGQMAPVVPTSPVVPTPTPAESPSNQIQSDMLQQTNDISTIQ